jgi:hypothetical protein
MSVLWWNSQCFLSFHVRMETDQVSETFCFFNYYTVDSVQKWSKPCDCWWFCVLLIPIKLICDMLSCHVSYLYLNQILFCWHVKYFITHCMTGQFYWNVAFLSYNVAMCDLSLAWYPAIVLNLCIYWWGVILKYG